MSASAKITVTAGPDRGRVYELTGDMVRLGRSPENDLVLSDAQLGEHHASIVFRDGRYAICAAASAGLEIDGTEVPSERWVWLPEAAMICFGRSTRMEFVLNGSGPPVATAAGAGSALATAPTVEFPNRPSGSASLGSSVIAHGRSSTAAKQKRSGEAPAPPGSDAPARSRKSGERGHKSRTIARFITDGPGDPLVKLGEDGHLPELALRDAQSSARPEAGGSKQSNPLLLILALSFSFGATLLLLVMDSGGSADNATKKANARAEIEKYYGREGEALKPYQEHLRRARLAHSSRDFEAERKEYREVLGLLRSEGNDKIYKYTGLTGRIEGDQGDQRLEELIGILLGD